MVTHKAYADPLTLPLKGPVLLEASAGTGKTYTIAALFLRLLLEQKLNIEQIVVVTFTRSAVLELRTRIRQRISQFTSVLLGEIAPQDPFEKSLLETRTLLGHAAEDAALLSIALRDIDLAQISTIHVFCARIIQEHRFLCDVAVGQVLNENSGPLIDRAIDDLWRVLAQKYPRFMILSENYSVSRNEQFSKLLNLVNNNPKASLPYDGSYLELDESLRSAESDLDTIHESQESLLQQIKQIWDNCREEIESLLVGNSALKQNSYKPIILKTKHLPELRQFIAAIHQSKKSAILRPLACQQIDKYKLYTNEQLASATRKNNITPTHPFFDLWSELSELEWVIKEQRRTLLEHYLCWGVKHVQHRLKQDKEKTQQFFFDDLLSIVNNTLSHPKTGTQLIKLLRPSIGAIMVDEFQDTDAIQFNIFKSLAKESTIPLVLIGDPKQAIYGFRGADIDTYFSAKSLPGVESFTLGTNWRSDPPLVAAVNRLFSEQTSPFASKYIDMIQVMAGHTDSSRWCDGGDTAPVLELLVPALDITENRTEDAEYDAAGGAGLCAYGEPFSALSLNKIISNKDSAEKVAAQWVAYDIARCLQKGATVFGRPLALSDIAVIIPSWRQAELIKKALQRYHIPVRAGRQSTVFQSPCATELLRVLMAIHSPSEITIVGGALATDLLGVGGEELRHTMQGLGFSLWQSIFFEAHEIFKRYGVWASLHKVFDRFLVTQRVQSGDDGDRHLTDLLHLVELLHRHQYVQSLTLTSLCEWFSETVNTGAASGDSSLEDNKEGGKVRIGSGGEAVIVDTVHGSKGLQYPVVYCPFFFTTRNPIPTGKLSPIRYREVDETQNTALDSTLSITFTPLKTGGAVEKQVMKEALAEDLRKLYVAVTRAKHRCILVWLPYEGRGKKMVSPLNYLLSPWLSGGKGSKNHLKSTSWCEGGSGVKPMGQMVGQVAGQGVGQHNTKIDPALLWHEKTIPVIAPPKNIVRDSSQDWYKSSYSALIADEVEREYLRRRDQDEDASESDIPSKYIYGQAGAATLPNKLQSKLNNGMMSAFTALPAGARYGTLLHQLLEEIDFCSATTASLTEDLLRIDSGFLGAEGWASEVAVALYEFLQTPFIGPHQTTLAEITTFKRLDELEFILPLQVVQQKTSLQHHSGDKTDGLCGISIAQALGSFEHPPWDQSYISSLKRLSASPLRGYMKGFIDLVFEHDGRWYVVDYKTNLLGEYLEDYTRTPMAKSMSEHHYYLQYLIYSVAVDRYLRNTLPDYSYESHFGGVYYLFIRGMTPQTSGQTGVFFHRPTESETAFLSQLFS